MAEELPLGGRNMSQPIPPAEPVKIRDHRDTVHSIDLANCTYQGQAVKPDYLEKSPNRISSDWLANRLTEGRKLELWQMKDGIWLAVDRTDLTGVVINGDQLRDLRPIGPETRQAIRPMSLTLEAKNYMVLRQTHWAPSGVCVVVGPNGVGKTTLLRLFDFLRNAYLRGAPTAIDQIGGVYGLRSWGSAEDEPVVVAFTIGDLRWQLQLTAKGPTLSDRLGERATRGNEVVFSRPALSQRLVYRGDERSISDHEERLGIRLLADTDHAEELQPLARALAGTRVYRNYNLWGLQTNGSRHSSDLYLHPSGQNALTVLRNWRDRRDLKPQYEFVIARLRAAFPEVFTDLDFHVAGLTVTVDLIDPKWNQACPLALAPDGLITGLLHLTAVAGAQEGSLIAIDDFGNDLHPYAIRALTEAIRDWAEERNLVVCLASHSPVLLGEFKEQPSSVFVMEHGLESRPVPLTDLYEADWLARFSLGRLYEHGEFGGQRQRLNGAAVS
jgi:predicted ATPase